MDEKEAIKRLNRRINQLKLNFAITNEDLEAIETVLNLLENKDKQIEQYQNMLATNDMLHVLECEKKDKIIDLMAKEIYIETDKYKNPEEVKQYFIRGE